MELYQQLIDEKSTRGISFLEQYISLLLPDEIGSLPNGTTYLRWDGMKRKGVKDELYIELPCNRTRISYRLYTTDGMKQGELDQPLQVFNLLLGFM